MDQFFRLTAGVVYSEVPEGSGLPRLPIPAPAPAKTVQRLILLVVLHRIGSRPTGFISQREIQAVLNRAGRDPIQTHLHALRTGRFLARSVARRGLAGADEYRPGARLKPDEWKTLAERLFGRRGICRGLLHRPAFGTGFLGHNGMLVLGALRRSKRPLKVAEIHRYLGFLIADEGTVRSRLKFAQRHGLVSQDGPQWSIAPGFGDLLKAYEENFGPDSRKKRLAVRHQRERQKNRARLLGCELTPSQEDELRRNGRCIRCRRDDAACLADEGAHLTIEHFPPRKWLKHWGLPDHQHFHFLICPSGNSRYGGHIRRTAPPELDKFIRISLRKSSDAGRIVRSKVEVELQRFYRHIDNGDMAAAARAAQNAASLWNGLIHRPEVAFVVALDGRSLDITGPKERRRQLRRQRRLDGLNRPYSAET